jgi:hypothetical protein
MIGGIKMKEKYLERLYLLNRRYNEFKVKMFGLKKNFNMMTNMQKPLEGDKNYVLSTIEEYYPEYFISINHNSDLLDNFHPISINAYAFMAVHLKSLKNKEDKDIIVTKYVSEINRRSDMYLVHI